MSVLGHRNAEPAPGLLAATVVSVLLLAGVAATGSAVASTDDSASLSLVASGPGAVADTGPVVGDLASRAPTASCVASPQDVAPGEDVTLDASDTTEANYVEFDEQGDGTYEQTDETDFTVTVTYDEPGTYEPRVRAYGSDQTDTADCGTVTVSDNSPPSASFTFSPASPTAGEPVSFDASASADTDGQIVEYRWDFDGDGTVDETTGGPTTSHPYGEAGDYVAVLTVVDEDGATSTTSRDVSVAQADPQAAFTFSPTSPTVGESVSFFAGDSTDPDGRIVEYRWDFDGDGTVDQTREVQVGAHQYQSAGTYTAVLTVVDDDGNTDSTTRDVVVEESSTPSAACTASPQQVAPGESVTLDASNTTNANYVEFDEQGDGTYEQTDETDFTVTATYDEPGTYEPQVRAYGSDQTDTADCGTVTVRENDPPTPAFSVSPNPGSVSESLTFDASASADPDGQVVEYRWDFDGDGTVDNTTTNPVTAHAYGQSGSYVARLTVVDDDGATRSTTRDVRIEGDDGGPEGVCVAVPDTVTPGEAVTLDASDSTGADDVEFDTQPDGTYETRPETGLQATVTYEEPGTYEPTARVWNYTGGETSTTVDCGTVTVGENQPPTPRLTHQPRPGVAGEPVALDASASADPDGQVVEYRWDFDNDGTVDNTTTRPTTTRSFTGPAATRGYAVVGLTVVDDDGATARINHTIELVRPEPVGRCSVGRELVEPGDGVEIDASASENVVYAQFDGDGDGEYERADETDFRETVVYDEPGEYAVTARLSGIGGERVTVDCGDVTVVEENVPPTATLTHEPGVVSPGGDVRLDASNSTDPDGRIVEYRWDFDNDGTVENTTTQPVVTHSFGSAGNYTVGLVVVDDDGATDATLERIPVRVPDEGGIPLWPIVPAGLIGGGFAGYTLCKGRSSGGAAGAVGRLPRPYGLFGGDDHGIEAQAAGTFETPAAAETVTVGGLAFEPDVLVFTATSNPSDDDGPSRTDGWSYGKAMREEDGTLAQTAVSVADDARSAADATGELTDDGAVTVVRSEDDGTTSLRGRVSATHSGGFEMAFEAVPDDRRYTVLFEAYAVADDADVAVGHAPIPDEPGTQSIPTGFAADHVVVTATDAVTAVDESDTSGDAVGVSHGEAVTTEDGLDQRVVTSAVDPQRVDRNAYAASEERAVHLLDAADPTARTTASVTALDGGVQLDYETVATDGVVTFLAVDAGERGRPAIGHFDVPAPDGDDSLTIDVGFEPALVQFTACPVDAVSGNRTVDESPLAFGFSHGSAMVGDGAVHQHMLHGAFDAADPRRPVAGARRAALADLATASPGQLDAAESPGEPDGVGVLGRTDGGRSTGEPTQVDGATATGPAEDAGTPEPDGDPAERLRFAGSSDAVAAALAVGADGQILGRDEVRVTGTTQTGFEIAVSDVSTRERGTVAERRPVVFYTAWPIPEGGR